MRKPTGDVGWACGVQPMLKDAAFLLKRKEWQKTSRQRLVH